MAKRQFSAAERYAVFTVHGEKCYMCGRPVDLLSMEVDHILPESFEQDEATLATVRQDYGLPESFELQWFANWMPSCGPCNNRKRSRVFNPTPRIQLELQIAADKAEKAAALASKHVQAQQTSRNWNTIVRAHEAGELSPEILEAILAFASFHILQREPDAKDRPVLLTPLVTLLSEQGNVRIVRGPYGIGAGPVGPDRHVSFLCPTCGYSAWNGPRCVVCGEMSDD